MQYYTLLSKIKYFTLTIFSVTSLLAFTVFGGSPVLASDWDGYYLGASIGHGSQAREDINLYTDNKTPINLGDSTEFSRGTIGVLSGQGIFGGLYVGHNWQRGDLVFGVEVDFQKSNISDGTTGRFTNPFGGFPIDGDATVDLNWFGTAKGRLGVANANMLMFVSAGVAFGSIDYKLNAIEASGSKEFKVDFSSNSNVGYVLGGGVEVNVRDGWSVKFEYQRLDFGTLDSTAPVKFIATGVNTGETGRTEIDAVINTFRVGITRKF